MATTKVVKVTILLRRDTLENWTKNDPILQAGEMSYVTDVGRCKVGDGQTHWKDLPYFILETDLNENAGIVIKTNSSWETEGRVISVKGTIYVYTDDDPNSGKSPRLKIGDGLAYICDLPFVTDDLANIINGHIADDKVHITNTQRQFWNDKVTAYISEKDPNNLILDDGNLIL